MDYLKAFLTGGIICAFVQLVMDKTKLMPGRIMVLLVVSGSILGFLGIYQPFVEWAGAGATVPLTGFGYNLCKGVEKAVSEKGFVGIFTGGFTAGAGGLCGAVVFSYVAALLFKPKSKS